MQINDLSVQDPIELLGIFDQKSSKIIPIILFVKIPLEKKLMSNFKYST